MKELLREKILQEIQEIHQNEMKLMNVIENISNEDKIKPRPTPKGTPRRKGPKEPRQPSVPRCLFCRQVFKEGEDVKARDANDFEKYFNLVHKKCLKFNLANSRIGVA